MCQLVLEHFAEHGESTRVMIFSTYRESVAELTGRLGKVAGVRPAIFVGQAKGKGLNNKGMNQRTQREVIGTLEPAPSASASASASASPSPSPSSSPSPSTLNPHPQPSNLTLNPQPSP